MSALIEEILDLVAKKAMVERASLRLEAKLTELNISSLDVVEIVFALEDKYGIELPFNANMQNQDFETLGQVIKVVEEKINEKNAKAAG
jgi:acyl carrier protein